MKNMRYDWATDGQSTGQHWRAEDRPGHDTDTPMGLSVSSLQTNETPTQNHKIEKFPLPSLTKTVRQSSCPLFLTFHRTCFMVRAKWPSELRGGTGRRGGWQVISRAWWLFEVAFYLTPAIVMPPAVVSHRHVLTLSLYHARIDIDTQQRLRV